MSNSICSVDGCEKTVHSKGLCQAHYRKARRNGSPTAPAVGKAGRPRGSHWSDEERAARAAAKRAREEGTAAPRVPINNPTHCANGHPYTDASRYVTAKGHILCRICRNIHRLKTTYGLTEEQLLAMSVEQGGCCKVCGDSFGDHTPRVDHDHQTGKVRGLLCDSCNLMLGHAKDSTDRLQAAIAYLRPFEIEKETGRPALRMAGPEGQTLGWA